MTKLFKFVSAVQFLKKFIHLYQQNRKLKNLDQFFIQHIMNGQKSIIQKTKIFYVLNFINFKTFFFSKLQIFNFNFFSIQIQDDVKINEIFFSAKPPKKLNLIFLFVKKNCHHHHFWSTTAQHQVTHHSTNFKFNSYINKNLNTLKIHDTHTQINHYNSRREYSNFGDSSWKNQSRRTFTYRKREIESSDYQRQKDQRR